MSTDRDIVHGYSEDRRVYRHKWQPIENKIPTKTNVSQRNSSEMLSFFSSSIKYLENLELATYRSIANNRHDFHMINYPIKSRPPTPVPNHQPQQPILPNSNPAKKSSMKTKINSDVSSKQAPIRNTNVSSKQVPIRNSNISKQTPIRNSNISSKRAPISNSTYKKKEK